VRGGLGGVGVGVGGVGVEVGNGVLVTWLDL